MEANLEPIEGKQQLAVPIKMVITDRRKRSRHHDAMVPFKSRQEPESVRRGLMVMNPIMNEDKSFCRQSVGKDDRLAPGAIGDGMV